MPPALSVSNTDSLGEQIQRRFPEAKVVKTLHTMNAYLMVDPTQLAGADHTVFVSAAGFVAALATILTLTFFLILGSERYLNAGVELFAEQHRPLVRRLLTKSAGAVTGYVTGNLAISVICGVTTFVVALVLGMPYAAALALLVGVLDLIPLVGATLGGALLVIVGLFVELWKAVVLLVYIVVYQQAEGSILQPIVYSHAVQLNALVIFIAVLVGGLLLGIPGALLAIPVAEIIRIVVTDLLAYRRERQQANNPAVSSPSQPLPEHLSTIIMRCCKRPPGETEAVHHSPECVEGVFCELRTEGFSEIRGTFLDLEMHTGTEGVGKRHRLSDVEPHPAGPEGGEVQPLHSCASQASRVAVAEARGSGSIA
jgi:hypothetical protein